MYLVPQTAPRAEADYQWYRYLESYTGRRRERVRLAERARLAASLRNMSPPMPAANASWCVWTPVPSLH